VAEGRLGAQAHAGKVGRDLGEAALAPPNNTMVFAKPGRTGVTVERGPTGVTGPVSAVTGPTGAASTVTGPTGITGPTGAQSTVTGPTGPSGGPTGPTGPDARSGANVQTLATGLTLAASSPRYQFLTATGFSSQAVILPTGMSAGLDFVIQEVDSFNGLDVEEPGSISVTTVYGTAQLIVWDGSSWRVISYY
jgi:hypothetical protein